MGPVRQEHFSDAALPIPRSVEEPCYVVASDAICSILTALRWPAAEPVTAAACVPLSPPAT